MPFARAVNPITETNWEDTGVEPDVPVNAENALQKAEELAAAKLEKRNDCRFQHGGATGVLTADAGYSILRIVIANVGVKVHSLSLGPRRRAIPIRC